MNWLVPLADVDIDEDEISAVNDVLRSKWLSMGSVTQAFEQEYAEMLGVKHALAVANGTAALHLACLVAGLQPGDEVIVPSLTFVATVNAVRYTGATPVFADILSQQTLNISPAAVENLINERTRAILVMHYGGYACDMPQIMQLAEKYHLMVIEDAAHAVNSELEGRKLGCWGDMGCFSFFSNKNMTTGEGGMLVTNDDALAEKLKLARSHGMTSLSWERHKGHAFSYDVVALGFNYRLDEMRAAIGRVQLKKLADNNKRRRELTQLYWELLDKVLPDIILPFRYHDGISAAHLMPVLLPEAKMRQPFMEHMKRNRIQTSIHYPPVHRFSAYAQTESSNGAHLPVTEDAAVREVTLPLYPEMQEKNVRYVCEAALSFFQ